ncbi:MULTISPECIES: hypothetical protein [Citrobacter]|uniref:hypothetical protein n=2 Tax=Citrobacter TaxID=544 RepID=UPI0015EAC9F4|nr:MULTISPECIES: hypothetical protein [Citrobacter]MDW2594607.1 hypothetical protein [Citrobacter braakii]MDW2658311.1 hypothetical protein [Citrobacter braakii]MDW2706136.1 hypothetical protein [Citrobacter braakii]MEB2437593.1 hypothetical protein [Citrobacter braakii]QLW41310.1 hypothetical protein HV229_12965 [Citrobacter sp. RHBSTW-00524]
MSDNKSQDIVINLLDDIKKLSDSVNNVAPKDFEDVCIYYNKNVKKPLDEILATLNSPAADILLRWIPWIKDFVNILMLLQKLLENQCELK